VIQENNDTSGTEDGLGTGQNLPNMK